MLRHVRTVLLAAALLAPVGAVAQTADAMLKTGAQALGAGTPYGALKAVWAYREAMKADPARTEAYVGLARAASTYRLRHGGEEKWLLIAVAALDAGLTRHPDRPELHAAFGNLYESAGMASLAVAAYGRALELTPGDATLRAALDRAKAARQPVPAPERWWEARREDTAPDEPAPKPQPTPTPPPAATAPRFEDVLRNGQRPPRGDEGGKGTIRPDGGIIWR